MIPSNTAGANREYVRLLLAHNQPAFARCVNEAVVHINTQRESDIHYDPMREMQDWMNEIRGCLPRPEGAPRAEEAIRRNR